jgi:hypothetical protein
MNNFLAVFETHRWLRESPLDEHGHEHVDVKTKIVPNFVIS